ncbi:metallophosphoesterase [Qipengyuania oceanensis]|uniref:Protein-tyrosine-phosphatase n=1 Tax=Qipengyuania oceanensis TaxID=1463597 RepID=A0A844YIF2_9SPHN|nr:metallophosphoesterase [Qipengyuania oceanensis]MXO62828.1 protein-tyrosine-phosphatase [Qipengyuania oceanensis]
MLRQLLTILATALFMGAVSASAQAPGDAQRIVAVGDLHGDLPAWEAIATAAGLVDTQGEWAGGETVLVQLGDVTDRGPDSLAIIERLRALQLQAPGAGGKVVLLIGNHEAMNVSGDLRYVHPGEYAAFVDRKSAARREAVWRANEQRIVDFYRSDDPDLPVSAIRKLWFEANPPGLLEHRQAWRPDGELGRWAASLPAAVKIGDTLFVHGGLSIERALRPLDEINAAIHAALGPGDETDRTAAQDPFGPLWYRGNVMRDADVAADAARPSIADELAQVLTYHDAARLVVGHTPSVKGILASNDGKLIRADTGISAHYGGPASFLEITPDGVTAHERRADGTWAAHSLDQQPDGDDP